MSLELPDVRAAAVEDPRGFLAMYLPPIIVDEVQYAPDLLPYIKERIDAERAKTGRYLLTGSQNLLLSEKVSESLAGRAAVLRLLPLSRLGGGRTTVERFGLGNANSCRLRSNRKHPAILWKGFPSGWISRNGDPTRP